MSADMIPLRSGFDPVRVELTSPGATEDGRRFYTVDYVDADGEDATVWGGDDLAEARKVAREIGMEDDLPVFDLTGAEPVEMAAGTVH